MATVTASLNCPCGYGADLIAGTWIFRGANGTHWHAAGCPNRISTAWLDHDKIVWADKTDDSIDDPIPADVRAYAQPWKNKSQRN